MTKPQPPMQIWVANHISREENCFISNLCVSCLINFFCLTLNERIIWPPLYIIKYTENPDYFGPH